MAQGPEEHPPLEGLRVVLVSPLYGGNVGSVCRAMANMGVKDLVVVARREWDQGEAERMSCSAKPILESIRYVDTVSEAVSDCGMVIGTTARLGLYRQHAQTPREISPEVLAGMERGRVAILFGPEDNGLDNDDIEHCTHLLRIPTTVGYSSLNLSQAVLIVLYEVFVAHGSYVHVGEKSEDATGLMRERMFEMWEQMLLGTGFMEIEKAQHMMLGIRRIFGRGQLSEDDVSILMGVARQSMWAASQGRKPEAEETV